MSSHGSHEIGSEKPVASHGVEAVDTATVKVAQGVPREGVKEKNVRSVSVAMLV
jgi:hypothetical protein